jgi:Intracellular proteinase inhibitor
VSWDQLAPAREADADQIDASDLGLAQGQMLRKVRSKMIAMYWIGLMLLLSMMLLGVDGCSHQAGSPGRPEDPLSLEAPDEVEAGQTVNLKLIWRNLTDQPIGLTLGGRPAYDFVVTTNEGKEIWRWLAGQTVQDILEIKTVDPGQKLEFMLEVQPVDQAGAALPPGNYLVHGILNLEAPAVLKTKPKPLIIRSKK